MITLKQESTLLKKLKSLTELELRGVLEELADHVRKNNFEEMVEEVFDLYDLKGEVRSLKGEVRSLELDVDELEIEKDRLETRIKDALNILEDIENIDDDVQAAIDKAIQELDI